MTFTRSLGLHDLVDSVCRPDGVIVLPETEHSPAICLQGIRKTCVPRPIGGNLLGPVLMVGSCFGAVIGASMPEASIQVYCDSPRWEDDVRPNETLTGGTDWKVNPVPKSQAV